MSIEKEEYLREEQKLKKVLRDWNKVLKNMTLMIIQMIT